MNITLSETDRAFYVVSGLVRDLCHDIKNALEYSTSVLGPITDDQRKALAMGVFAAGAAKYTKVEIAALCTIHGRYPNDEGEALHQLMEFGLSAAECWSEGREY